jgi:hypothetical protein
MPHENRFDRHRGYMTPGASLDRWAGAPLAAPTLSRLISGSSARLSPASGGAAVSITVPWSGVRGLAPS